MSIPFDIPTVQPSGGELEPAVAFFAYQSNTIAGQANQDFTYNVVDIGSDHFDGTFFTAPKAGLFQFNWINFGGRFYTNTQVDAQMLVQPAIGGSAYPIGFVFEFTVYTGTATGSMTTTARILKGDKVFVKSLLGWQMKLSPTNNQATCWFSGYYISP